MKKIRIIEAFGTPYEIGYIHGSKGKEEVLRSIETYKTMFMDYANLKWNDAKEKSRSYIKHIEDYDKDILEEMKGVAEGAGVDLEDILAINARSEVIMMVNEDAANEINGGCTSIAVTPEATKNSDTLLAQNWDWKASQLESLLILKIKQQNKPDIQMITEGGIIGKIGFNSAGIGLCFNALGTVGNPSGLPLHVILRGILNSVKLSDAIEKINSVPNACASNYLLASRIGEALDVEKSPVDFEVIYPTNGILAHSNNFLTDRLKPGDTSRFMAHDTFLRYGIARKMLDSNVGNIDTNLVKEILASHKDYPDSICRHEDPLDVPGMRMCTCFSIVMNLSTMEMEIAYANPCENRYIKI